MKITDSFEIVNIVSAATQRLCSPSMFRFHVEMAGTHVEDLN